MIWELVSHVRGFTGAEAIFVTNGWLLAKWNHSKCRGWQLYRREAPFTSRTRWMAGAGAESLGWTKEMAMDWASQQIATSAG
jgi:hypothetical protein